MDATSRESQLLLFTAPDSDRPRPRRHRPPAGGGRPRMIDRLEGLAEAAEREARACRRAGDMMNYRAARDRAVGARRAAQLLRAGPGGIASLLSGDHEAA